MKLTYSCYSPPNNRSREIDIKEAVEMTCRNDFDSDIENTQNSIERTAEMLGNLMQKLSERGLLDDEDVLELLPQRFSKSEPDDSP